jgi:CRISPR/Cas system-associated endonuclease Cas1
MCKKVNYFTVVINGEEVIIKRCTGCCKDKALGEYSKGVALFSRQAKCKACNKEEYAAKKAYWDGFKKETDEQRRIIRFIHQNFPTVRYSGITRRDATHFINLFIELGYITFIRDGVCYVNHFV